VIGFSEALLLLNWLVKLNQRLKREIAEVCQPPAFTGTTLLVETPASWVPLMETLADTSK
jgi:hypothetical protein